MHIHRVDHTGPARLAGQRRGAGRAGGRQRASPLFAPPRPLGYPPPTLLSCATDGVSLVVFFFLPESVQDAYVWKTLDWREMLIACVHMH